MAEFELTDEKLLGLRKLVSVCYSNIFSLRNEPFEDVYQTALLHVVETQTDFNLSTWLFYNSKRPKEYYDYNYPALFADFRTEEDTKDPDHFVESLAPIYDPYDEDLDDDYKVIYYLGEILYKKREDLREGFMHYCFGEESDILTSVERGNIRRKLFNKRFLVLKELFESGYLSFEVYTKYLKLANEIQKLPKLSKNLSITSESIKNRKSYYANRDKRLAYQREYNKNNKQARLDSAKEQQQ